MVSDVAHVHLPVPEKIELLVVCSEQLHSLPLLPIHPASCQKMPTLCSESLLIGTGQRVCLGTLGLIPKDSHVLELLGYTSSKNIVVDLLIGPNGKGAVFDMYKQEDLVLPSGLKG